MERLEEFCMTQSVQIAAVAGYVDTRVMAPMTSRLYQLEDEQGRR